MHPYKIIIVGGGPSGMMAAIRAAEVAGYGGVALFEKNASLGRKLSLTGRGRCNLTNVCGLSEFIEKFGANGRFLHNVFNRFFVQELMQFFESRGLKLKIERQKRVFPDSDESQSVLDVLRKSLIQVGVDVYLSSPIKSVNIRGAEIKSVLLSSCKEFQSQNIIISTGGCSYPQTGSTGDGLVMAHKLGHKIAEPMPGLVPLETQESIVKDLQGLTLKNVRLVFCSKTKKIESSIGELLFTHFGVSGPLVLDLSAQVCALLKEGKVELLIDLKPNLTHKDIDLKLQSELQSAGSAKVKNYLGKILPQRLIPILLKVTGIDGEKKCHQITLAQRKKIVEFLKGFSFSIRGARPLSEAMVTCGGVSLKEIDPKTMESKKIKGLYFCGEVLDLAASSGGFNLQAAFSTGYIAGESAALSLKI